MFKFKTNLKILKRVFNFKEDKLILGRWNYTKNFEELEKKVYLANHDHCGPCGKIKQKNNLKMI